MEAEARYTFVGAACSRWSRRWWSAWCGSRARRHAASSRATRSTSRRQALDGLEVGGDVKLRGIKVGRVQDYALSGDKLNRVRVEVRVDRRAPVRTNTVAVVTRNFVTGIAAITLVTPEPPGERSKKCPRARPTRSSPRAAPTSTSSPAA